MIGCMTMRTERYGSLLADALAGARTKPVTVTLPAPLAEAYRHLVTDGVEASVSAAVTDALVDRLQTLLWDLRLESLYAHRPELRPTDAEVNAMGAEMRLSE